MSPELQAYLHRKKWRQLSGCLRIELLSLDFEQKVMSFHYEWHMNGHESLCVSSETGSAITSTCIGLGETLTPPAGQAGKPVPGYNGKSFHLALAALCLSLKLNTNALTDPHIIFIHYLQFSFV